jgi:predicted lipid-binding transport protein (Tim44 family)
MTEPTRRRVRRAATLLFALLLAAHAADALARVGGGHTYSSGSSHSSSSHSSSGGSSGGGEASAELVWLLIRLTFEYPQVMIPLWGVVAAAWWWSERRPTGHAAVFDRMSPAGSGPGAPLGAGPFTEAWRRLAEQDSALSRPVLEDHLQLVWRRAWAAVADPSADAALATWASPGVLRELRGLAPTGAARDDRGARGAVSDVVIAGLELVALRVDATPHELVARFRGSRVEAPPTGGAGRAEHVYTEETWTFSRAPGARSLAPDVVHRMGCPSCGAALQVDPMGRCAACETAVTTGQLAWRATQVRQDVRRVLNTRAADERGELLHPHIDVEPGWHAPTVFDPDLARQARALIGREHAHSEAGPGAEPLSALEGRVRATFAALQAAWDAGDWDAARPYTTDTSWNTLRFWIERYKAQKLRNRVRDPKIERMRLTRVTLDAWYESATFRVWARAVDWVEDADGDVVGGSDKQPRRFSEYWTFVRAVGAKRHDDDATRCPSCGAPLDRVNAAGVCGYCDSVLTTGAYDWVLTRIDQAEGYTG